MPPSVAPQTLSNEVCGAMKKRHSHRSRGRFSSECCAKNTQIARRWPDPYGSGRPDPAIADIFIHFQWVTINSHDRRRSIRQSEPRLWTGALCQNDRVSAPFCPSNRREAHFQSIRLERRFPIMQGLTRIAVRKNRLDGHPSDRNRITYARSNPANRESASGSCIHPQKNLPEEFLATRKARHRSGPAEVLQSASARSRLAEPEGFEPSIRLWSV